MAVICDEDVFGFELPVNDAVTVEDFDSVNYLSDEVSDDVLTELDLLFLQVKIYVALVQVLHYDVNFVLVLECLTNRY